MELEIPEDVTGLEIDRAVRSELRTLSKENAQGVGAHLVMVARLLDDDIELARAHADAAVRRAGRVPSVREARGMVAYHEGDWNVALSEFRTARRLSGSHHLLPYLIDCERALGRPEKALDLAKSPEANSLPAAERAEIAIVISGIRRELGQHEAALTILEGPHLVPGRTEVWAPRVYYAYADALMDLDRVDDARRWFQAAADADTDLQTDAWERLDEIDGTVFELVEPPDEAQETADAAPVVAASDDEASPDADPADDDPAHDEPDAASTDDAPSEDAPTDAASTDTAATDTATTDTESERT